jgi:hypothetical protein
MVYQKYLQVPYHQQNTHYHCAAACAQMVLASPGVNAGLLNQDQLYTDSHQHSKDESHLSYPSGNPLIWATAPDGLSWVLNDRRPPGFNNPFVEYSLNSEDAIFRKIAWTIEHYGVAPCALVSSSNHWVVVRGISVSQAPTSSTDTSYILLNLRINNPWPPVPGWIETGPFSGYYDPNLIPPPPHSSGDGCGTGEDPQTKIDRGLADEVINDWWWRNTYMIGANYHPQGYWQGKFVAVCDPDPPPTRPGVSRPRECPFKGDRLITRAEAIRLAMNMIKKQELPQDEPWQQSLEGVKPANPVLVQRLDRLDEYYCFVPLFRRDEGATAALAFDARFGNFLHAISFPKPDSKMLNPPTRSHVLKQVVGKRFQLEKYRGSLLVRKATVLNNWYWKPCSESLSPFWPFKIAVCGKDVLYYRIDGKLFTMLHQEVLGI